MIDFNALIRQSSLHDDLLTTSAKKLINNHISSQLTTGIMILDESFNVLTLNRFLQVHSSKKMEDVIGQSIFTAFSELPEHWLTRKLNSVLQLNSPSYCSWQQRHHLFELLHTRPITTDSEFMAQNCTFLPIVDKNNRYICILIEDVTDVCYYQGQLQKALDDLAHMNRVDGLTQVFNRRHWQETLNQEYTKARRHNKNLSLIMLDFDHFKMVNDDYGHQCGDRVLIEVSALIADLLRIEDIFGRYGGEEFSIILPETNLAGAADLAKRICDKVSNMQINYHGVLIPITLSLGVAQLSEKMSRYEELITLADNALYLAKAEGRNRVCSSLDLESIALS